MPEVKEAHSVFVSVAIFDRNGCKDFVVLKRLKFVGGSFKSDVGQDLSSECSSCLFGYRRLCAVRLALLETSFEDESMLEHRRIEFESGVIEKLVDFFSG